MFNMKHLSATTLLALVAGPYLIQAAPLSRRQAPAGVDPNNVLVLQFANVLEQLETTFYSQALQKFQASDFTGAGFSSAQIAIEQITVIGSDEATHTTIIQEELVSLGQQPLTCQFNLESTLTDVTTMLTVARLVENVGVGAYLGAAHLISDPTILTAAASILTVEARHQTILNVFNNGAAIPNAFDLPLMPNEVLSIAGGFIQGCDLGVPANTALTITNTEVITIATQVTFNYEGIPSSLSGSNLFCQIMAGGMPVSVSQPIDQCSIPSGMSGPVAIWITADSQPLNNNVRDRANQTVIAGPMITFIDVVEEQISQVVRVSSGSSSSSKSSSSSSSGNGSSSNGSSQSSSSVVSTSAVSITEAVGEVSTGSPMVKMISAPTSGA